MKCFPLYLYYAVALHKKYRFYDRNIFIFGDFNVRIKLLGNILVQTFPKKLKLLLHAKVPQYMN